MTLIGETYASPYDRTGALSDDHGLLAQKPTVKLYG